MWRETFLTPLVEDKGLILARKLKLQMVADQIQPAILPLTRNAKLPGCSWGEAAVITAIRNCRNIGIVSSS